MYCRVLAHRQTDPTSGDNIVMISHQDVTALRLVEGELGRLQMQEQTNKGLMQQDSDVAGSLLTLLGEPDHGLTVASSRRTPSFEVDGSGDSSSPLLERMDSSGDLGTAEGKDEVERQSGLSKKLDALRRVLAKAGDWQFDVFELQLEAQGQPLQVLAWHVLWTHGLIDEFNLDHFKLIKFLKQVSSYVLGLCLMVPAQRRHKPQSLSIRLCPYIGIHWHAWHCAEARACRSSAKCCSQAQPYESWVNAWWELAVDTAVDAAHHPSPSLDAGPRFAPDAGHSPCLSMCGGCLI